eukprot:3136870-Karenia_brevis.AAC.1
MGQRPPGGGKSTVLTSMSVFGGEKKNKLCLPLGSNYLHDRKRRGSEECKPILANLSGKALGYCDEFPHG